jgi:hypothetical protein
MPDAALVLMMVLFVLCRAEFCWGKGKFQGGGGGDNLTVSVNHREAVSERDRVKGAGGRTS